MELISGTSDWPWAARSGVGSPDKASKVGKQRTGTCHFSALSQKEDRLLVKVINGCSVNGHNWVARGSASAIPYALRVRDSKTGIAQTYTNSDQGGVFLDQQAFGTCR